MINLLIKSGIKSDNIILYLLPKRLHTSSMGNCVVVDVVGAAGELEDHLEVSAHRTWALWQLGIVALYFGYIAFENLK